MKKYSKHILILIISIMCSSCGNIITVLDEYNSPYAVKATGTDGIIYIEFVSGVTASDFVGFNLYANTTGEFVLYDDAILNSDGGLPTISESPHSRQIFTYEVPATFISGVTYYVTVTAYGTNPLAENGRIETAISTIVEVVP